MSALKNSDAMFLFLNYPRRDSICVLKAKSTIDFVYMTVIILAVVDTLMTKPKNSFHAARVAIIREGYLEGGGHGV